MRDVVNFPGMTSASADLVPGPSRRLIALWAVDALLGTAAVVAVLICGLHSLSLSVSFEPSDTSRYEGQVAGGLGVAAALGAALIAVVLVVARPWRPRGRVAAGVAFAVLASTLAVQAAALRHAQVELHPSFAAERAAVRAFDLPPHADETPASTEVLAHPVLTASWTIAGHEKSTCAAIDRSFTTWADPGSVREPARPLWAWDRVGRRGRDDVLLRCFGSPTTPVYVDLVLTSSA